MLVRRQTLAAVEDNAAQPQLNLRLRKSYEVRLSCVTAQRLDACIAWDEDVKQGANEMHSLSI